MPAQATSPRGSSISSRSTRTCLSQIANNRSLPIGGVAPEQHRSANDDHAPAIHQTIAKTKLFREHDTKVLASVRACFVKVFPEIFENNPFSQFDLRMFNHILSPVKHDEDTGGTLIPHELIAQFAGGKSVSNFESGKHLEQFHRRYEDRMQFVITYYSWYQHRARTITAEWPAPILQALAAHEYLTMSTDDIDKARQRDLVYFMSGDKVSRAKRTRENQAIIAERQNISAVLPLASMQKPILDLANRHLTERRQTLFNVIQEGIPRLQTALIEYLRLPYPTHKHGKKLDAACLQGQHYYREWLPSLIEPLSDAFVSGYYVPGDKGPRVHTIGLLLHYFPRSLRKALLANLTSLDLKSSQFAIAAKLWGADKALVFLEKGQNIWTHFLVELGLEPEMKPVLKMTLYALCFGRGMKRLQSELVWDLKDAGFEPKAALLVAKRFLASEIMQDLLQAREKQMAKIREEGGIQLPDWQWGEKKHEGVWLELDQVPQHWLNHGAMDPLDKLSLGCENYDKSLSTYEHNVRSLCAQQIQAAELNLMNAAVEVIEETQDITLVSFLHDGFTLAFRDEDKRQAQTKAVQGAVDRRCRDLGFFTSLQSDK